MSKNEDLRVCKKCLYPKRISDNEFHKKKESFSHVCKLCTAEISKEKTKALKGDAYKPYKEREKRFTDADDYIPTTQPETIRKLKESLPYLFDKKNYRRITNLDKMLNFYEPK